MSDLTYEKMRAMLDSLPKPDLFNPFRMPFRLMGREIYDAPPPAPKIQVRQIYLNDGTPLLPTEFLAEQNNWWAAEFGYRDDPFKDKIYLLGSYGMVMRPEYRHMITSMTA
jgi:hypothetical protein